MQSHPDQFMMVDGDGKLVDVNLRAVGFLRRTDAHIVRDKPAVKAPAQSAELQIHPKSCNWATSGRLRKSGSPTLLSHANEPTTNRMINSNASRSPRRHAREMVHHVLARFLSYFKAWCFREC